MCICRPRLLRKNEGDEVEAVFGPNGNYDLNFIRVNAQERFYAKLKGVEDPEAKRKIIGEEFIRVFEEEAKKIGAVDFLYREQFIRMLLRAVSAVNLLSSSPIITWEDFLIMLILKKLSSRLETCLRMKCAKQD